MKKTITCIALSVIALNASAQIEYGGEPYGWETEFTAAVDFIEMPPVDIKKYQSEDKELDQHKDIPYRFGVNIETDIDLNTSGAWETIENGDRIWRLGISAPGAISLNFVFDAYFVPEGGKIFVYNADKTQLKGSFTAENTSKIQSLGVGLIQGDNLIVEYHEPLEVQGQGYLHINNVTHGYRSVLGIVAEIKSGPFGNSGSCNINVNCPVGLPYDIQKRSAAIIVVNNSGLCSGAMVNNTSQDGTPYFLTARHCLPSNTNNTNNWLFYFNHETPSCFGSTGPTNQSVSGGELKASNQESDFALLELNSTPPASYNVCYSGWDATDNAATVTSAYGIHHPAGDVKKICFEENAPYHEFVGGFVNQTWYIDQWESGVTEGGSSGSPLFNQNGVIIGTLSGGLAACSGTSNNGQYDFYGRFGVSWDYGSTASGRLKDWLDPTNSGVLVVGNSCSGDIPVNDITIGAITGISSTMCNLEPVSVNIPVINTGSATVTSFVLTYSLNGGAAQIANWSGSLASFANAQVTINDIMPQEGENSLVISVSTVNGTEDESASGNSSSLDFIVLAGESVSVTLEINFDDYPEETTWTISDNNGNTLYAGGPYPEDATNFAESFCLAAEQCYEFTIFDDYGDGICCAYGNGNYVLTDASGNTIASGGEFESDQSTIFCPGGFLSASNVAAESIQIYPNPARDQVRIDLGDNEISSAGMRILDATGRTVWESSQLNAGTVFEIPTSSLASGIYMVSIHTVQSGMLTKKLMIQR